jgi:sulfotransferase family protein
MAWRTQINVRLARSTGMQLRQRDGRLRLVRNPPRELSRPAFIFSSVRSGSTLLRLILNSHSQVYAPHELHLANIKVEFGHAAARHAVEALQLDKYDLTHMLWDRLLTQALHRSGKSVLVEKTPNLVFVWERVARCWPDGRYIFLLRNPAAIVDSWQRNRSQQSADEVMATVTRYLIALRDARRALPGHTIRYEDLTADPAGETRRVCAFLGIDWEPAMVEYGNQDHGELKFGLGDWTEKIRTGSVQPPRPLPAIDLSPKLRELTTEFGY